jgi:single-strand DNA-binding protein
MNKVILMGRLTRDPEVRYTPSGKVVCSFTVAVDRPFTNQEGQREADFIPVVVWGKSAELCGNSLSKGQRIMVDGRMQVRSYDGKDGIKRWVTEVIANNVEFVEPKSASANRGVRPTSSQNSAEGANAATGGAAGSPSGMETLGSTVPMEEDIPF